MYEKREDLGKRTLHENAPLGGKKPKIAKSQPKEGNFPTDRRLTAEYVTFSKDAAHGQKEKLNLLMGGPCYKRL